MKLVNKSEKIICVDTTILMPDKDMKIAGRDALSPAVNAMIEKGWLFVDDSEEVAAQHEAEIKAAAEKAAAEKEAEINAAVAKAMAEKEAKEKSETKKRTAKAATTTEAEK